MGSVVSKPEVTFSLLSADVLQQNAEQRLLLVGLMLSGTATPGDLIPNIGNENQEDALFGITSQMAEMVRTVKQVSSKFQLDGIAIADTGTARVIDITFTTTATIAGTVVLNVGGKKDFEFRIPVAVGDTPTAFGIAAVALINANLKCRYTASEAVGVLTLTADNTGLVANQDPIGIEILSTDMTASSITTGNTAGATNPTTTTVLDVIGDERYQGIVWPFNDQIDDPGDFLDGRFNANNAVLNGVVFVPAVDTYSNVSALASENNQSVVILGDKLEPNVIYNGPSIPEPGWRVATMFAAIRALRLTEGQSISRYNTTNASRDAFGGPALASLPYFNMVFPELPGIAPGLGWTGDEVSDLLSDGVGIVGQNSAGSSIIAGEIPTTYLTNGAGASDPTWRFLNYVDTASGCREYFHNNVKARFAQSRLTQGTTPAGRDMANEDKIKAYLVRLYSDLAGIDFVLVQDGPAAVKAFRDSVTIAIVMVTGTVTITFDLPIITQTRVINASIKIDFDIAT